MYRVGRQSERASLRFDGTYSTLTRKNTRAFGHAETSRPSDAASYKRRGSLIVPDRSSFKSPCTHQAGEFQSNEIARNYVQARTLKRLRFKGIRRPVHVVFMGVRMYIHIYVYVHLFTRRERARKRNYVCMQERCIGERTVGWSDVHIQLILIKIARDARERKRERECGGYNYALISFSFTCLRFESAFALATGCERRSWRALRAYAFAAEMQKSCRALLRSVVIARVHVRNDARLYGCAMSRSCADAIFN